MKSKFDYVIAENTFAHIYHHPDLHSPSTLGAHIFVPFSSCGNNGNSNVEISPLERREREHGISSAANPPMAQKPNYARSRAVKILLF